LKLRTKLNSEQNSELSQLISAARSSMHAVKSVKDIGTNITNLSRSSKDIKYQFFLHHKNETQHLYIKLNAFLKKEEPTNFEELEMLFDTIQKNYTTALNTFYTEVQLTTVESIDITTVINFNRELFTSNKAMLMAVKDVLLDEKNAQNFNEIPIYKT
jgi:phosphate:Na+ symporter